MKTLLFTSVLLFSSSVLASGLSYKPTQQPRSIKPQSMNYNLMAKPTEKGIKEVTVSMADFKRDIKSVLTTVKIHLNNYGPARGTEKGYKTWYKGGDSWMKYKDFSNNNESKIIPINIPGFDKGALGVKARFYVNDINSLAAISTVSGKHLKLIIDFESNGVEIKGHCSSKSFLNAVDSVLSSSSSSNDLCVLGTDYSIPDMQMNNLSVIMYMYPIVEGGKIRFKSTGVNVKASVQAQGACNVAGLSSICNAVGYKTIITTQVKKAVSKKSTIIAKMLSKAFTSPISPLVQQGIKNIRTAKIKGNNLVVTYKP